MMFTEQLYRGGQRVGVGDVGVGFDLNHVPHRDELPRWMVDHIRKAEKVSTIEHLAFAAKMWLKGYGRLSGYGLPTMTKDATQEPSWMGPLYNWDDPFWKASAQRAADRNDGVAHPMFWRTVRTSTISPITAAAKAVSSAVKTVEKIPVAGSVVSIIEEVYTAPIKVATRIASGERLDHVAMDALKDQLKIAKDVAPYASTVVALVPGIGTGAAAAIAAGAALAEGKSIDEVTKAAVRGALPGGAIAQAAFDTAMKAAAGERIDQAALESARNLVPEGAARTAFDVGVAVAHGEKIQNAVAKGLVNLAGAQAQTILAEGVKALSTTPGLADALKKVPPGAAEEGFKLAAGLLSKSGVGEKAITEVRGRLTPDLKQGFDAALKSQEEHVAWIKNVTGAPTMRAVPKKATPAVPATPTSAKPSAAPTMKAVPAKPGVTPAAAAGKFGPYPNSKPVQGAVHGLGAFFGDDHKWRWIAVYANGKLIAQRGPMWLSDNDAHWEGVNFVQATLGRNYIGTVQRWDWNPDARRWEAVGGSLGEPGLGADTTPTTADAGFNAAPWVLGGILVAAAVGVYALEKHGPEPFRRSA